MNIIHFSALADNILLVGLTYGAHRKEQIFLLYRQLLLHLPHLPNRFHRLNCLNRFLPVSYTHLQCIINGKLTNLSNNNHENGYFVDQHTYKCAKKYNVSGYNIPNKFSLELFAFISKADTSEENYPVAFTKLFNGQYDGITDNDKNAVWYISTDIDKSKVKISSITKDINLKLPNSDATVEKAVFSPFGNQLVLSLIHI